MKDEKQNPGTYRLVHRAEHRPRTGGLDPEAAHLPRFHRHRPGGPPHGPVGRNGHGLVTNLLWGVISGPVAAAFAPVAMVIGLVAGLAARKGLFRSLAGAVIAGVVITLFVTLVATPIRTYLFGGVTGSGADFFVAYLTAVGQKLLQSVALTVIWTNRVDKIVACLVAQAVVRQLPGRIRSLFPGAENVA